LSLSFASVLGGATPASQAFAAEPPACRAIEIKFDLIKRQITSVETNQLLFASADNGCEELARRLLADGASSRRAIALAPCHWRTPREPA
jgi:hypothetical protein